MLAKFKQMPLERQLFISFVSVSSILLLVTMGIMLYVDITRQLRSMDDTIRSSAAYIAQLEAVEDMLEQGYPDPAVSRQLDSLSENVKDLNVIVIYNTSGLRFYHTDRQQSGETFVEGEEVPILEGSEPYITTGYSTYGSQRRAFHAVENDQGEIIGFVMTSIFTSDIWEQNRVIVIYALVILGVVLLLGVGLSRGIVALLRGSLKGHHPTELLELYLKQEDVLNAIEDGLVATDREGTNLFQSGGPAPSGRFPGGTGGAADGGGFPGECLCPGGQHRTDVPQPFLRDWRAAGTGQRSAHSGRRGTGRRAECAA